MLILLPPSETKRTGGTGPSLSLSRLRYPELSDHRRALIDAVEALAGDTEASIAALKLGATQHGDVELNRRLWSSPTLPALDRYTGVLFDALGAGSLDARARAFAAQHVVIHAALFGPVGALDPIPAYRLSHNSRVPSVVLARHWRDAVEASLLGSDGLVLDMRSEAYVALGPAPSRPESVYLRVLTEGESGVRRALNHFNKKSKGEFTRSIVQSGHDFASVDELVAWGLQSGWRLEPSADRELALVV
ncbi:peroxide stress protein YaaA [Okibacterium endophyticum]